ncbi:RNA polymerase sigma factor [Streptomyces mesophilus]|uniref:RNA polymerase sigma factor n=1 Tax=Streptomyces mesophilus TaxID=1775132 RepID=UPI00332B7C12
MDPGDFEEFYRRHFDAITGFVARRVGDPHTVADLTAEVFLAVIDSSAGYDPARGSETAWLYGIARNVVCAESRRSARQSVLGARVAGRRLLDEDDIVRLEERLDAESAARLALAAMGQLPDGEKAVLELIVVDQLTVGEAAKVLGIRPVTARVRLHRARRALAGTTTVAPGTAPLTYAGETA